MNPRNVRLISISIVAVAMFAGQLLAGKNQWTSRGPRGGSIEALVADRANPAILYAGTYGSGVYKSEDAGASWRPVNEGMSDLIVYFMVMRRDRAATLFANTSRGTLFRTRDGGEHWTEVTRPSSAIWALAFDHVRGSLYALPSGGFELMRSDDEGDTWQTIHQDVIWGKLIALDGKLYANYGGGTLYVSSDGGSAWTPLPGIDFPITSVAVDEERSSIVVGGKGVVARSDDAGKNWERLPLIQQTSDSLPLTVNALSPYAGGVVVATNAGVFRYTNGATAWTTVGNGLAGVSAWLLVRTTSNSERIFAFGSVASEQAANLYAWTAGQEEWKAVDPGLRSARTNDLAVAGSTVYAATWQGLSSLTEDSEGWKAIDVSSSGTLDMSTVDAKTSGVVIVGTPSGLHKSDDRGATWKMVSGQRTTAVGVAASNSTTVYAALADAMSKSTDGGDTWYPIQSNIPEGFYFYYYGFSASTIEVDRTNASIVYVCTDDVYKSIDGGIQWKSIFHGWMSAFAIDHFNPSLLYGATSEGVWRSDDAGTSWELLNFNEPVYALAVDPARPSVVYAGTDAGNVYRSVNGGRHWISINTGLSGAYITKLAVDSSGNRLYAATAAGVFEYERDTTYLAGATTHRVSLRTYYANFVSADDCGDSRVSANATSAGPCETFTLYDINGGTLVEGDRVYLQAPSGSFVAAENGGSSVCRGCNTALNADRPTGQSWETFTIRKVRGIGSGIADGDSISLQSNSGDYVSADGGGSNGCGCDSVLNANRPEALAWETFNIIIH